MAPDDEELAAARRLFAARQAIYDYMKSHGDFRPTEIAMAKFELGDALARVERLTGTVAEQTEVLKALSEEIKRQNEVAEQIAKVPQRSAVRALADLISGQILRRGMKPRSDDDDDGLAGVPARV